MDAHGSVPIQRRSFLKLAGAVGTGLAIGYWPFGGASSATPEEDAPYLPPPNKPWVWIKITPDDVISVVIPRCEMGQGSLTALAMLFAEELEVDLARIQWDWAPPFSEVYGRLLTGASDAVRTHWRPLREAAAMARTLLVYAAAARWGVPDGECRVSGGRVIHAATDRSSSYGELADAAARLPLPATVELKGPETFALIGRSVPRLDLPEKVTGSAVFGIDVQVPGMLIATIIQSPVYFGNLKRLDATEAKKVEGVRHVLPFKVPGSSRPTAVAVVADSYWSAIQGAEALRLTWEGGEHGTVTSESILSEFRQLSRQSRATPIVDVGDLGRAFAQADRTLSATYFAPYLAHATMEPMNCTASVQGDRCEIWVPTQDPDWARDTAAYAAEIPLENVVVHQTYLGGGFGRRQRSDYVAQAVRISRAIGAPVKLIWSREEDIRQDYYRPATLHVLKAGLDRHGFPIAWSHRIVGIGGSNVLVNGVDSMPYAIPAKRIELVRRRKGPVRTGPWRGMALSQNVYVTECFLDEIAGAGGLDPLELRRHLLRDAPRHRAVLELAAEKAGWGGPADAGHRRGLAITDNVGGICAEVAECSVENGAVRVHRIVCAADCGRLVHPDVVAAQMEGGIVFGITAALKGNITIRSGRVEQSNFHDYPLLRMPEAPAIDVHLVASDEDPGGVGETSLPPVAPAVANAVFAATGRPVRKLPIEV